MVRSADLLPGTCDLLVLRTLARAPMHGYEREHVARRALGMVFGAERAPEAIRIPRQFEAVARRRRVAERLLTAA